MAEETEVETVTRIRAVDIRDLFPALAAEDATSRVCLLCAAKLKDKTHNLTRHLERHHAGALLQLLEQRNQASPSALASRTKRVQQEKTARQSTATTMEVEDALLQAGDAKLTLARWLAQEQLPVDLVEKSGFLGFLEALNEQFSPPKREELRQLLGSLVGAEDGKVSGLVDVAMDGDDVPSTVEMMALRATCRCSEDSPLVTYSQVACDIAERGEAKVRVLRAAASLFDAQTCRGSVLGRSGVLGRPFLGVVSEMQPSVPNETNTAAIGEPVKVLDKVVASPYIARVPVSHQDLQAQEQQEDHDESSLQSSHSSTSCIGVSAPSGCIAEFIVLPVSNLCVVPTAVPDDVALLSDDIAVVLAIVSELQRRHVTKIAILTDGPATILSSLLTRYLHQDLQLAPQTLHLFATSTTGRSSVHSQHACFTPLDIYRPADVARVLARQTELVLEAVVDLIGSEASAEFATSLVQSMGCVVLVDRSRLELQPPSTVAMDMNAVVVRELEIVSVHDCRGFLDDAMQYLSVQVQDPQSAMELRECLLPGVELSQALHELQTIPEAALEARYLQVVIP